MALRAQLMLSQQTIFVDREDRNSAVKAAEKIVRRVCYVPVSQRRCDLCSRRFARCAAATQNAIARDSRWPRIVTYPEGNTCNGRQLCAFKARPCVIIDLCCASVMLLHR
jgi:hypothetical protein